MFGKKKGSARNGQYESVPLVDPNASTSVAMATSMSTSGANDSPEEGSALSFDSPFEFATSDKKSEIDKKYRSIFTYSVSPENQFARSSDPRGRIHFILTLMGYSIVVLLFPLLGWFSLKRLRNHERMVVFRFGRLIEPKGPGMVAVLPLVDKCEVVSLANKAFSIPPGLIHCEDGGIVEAGGEVIFRVLSPVPAVTEVCDRDRALRNLCQATLRTVLSKFETERMDKLRPEIIRKLHDSINSQIQRWGIEVSRVELVGIRVLKTPPSILSRFNLSSLGQQIGPMLAPLFAQMPNPEAAAAAAAQAFANAPILVPPPDGDGAGPSHAADATGATSATPGVPGASDGAALGPLGPATSVEWLLDQMRLKLGNEKIRERLEGAAFAFFIEEDEGGAPAPAAPTRYCIDARAAFVGEGGPPDGRAPDVTLSMTRSTLMALLQGEVSPTCAYMSGAIGVEGELQTAMRLQALNS